MGRTSEARGKIILTTLKLVQARSYSSVSVDELCIQAGVNRGSFYYFFSSKRELLLEALQTHWQLTRQEVFEPAFSADIPLLDRITRAFELAFLRHKALQNEVGFVLGCPFGNVAAELSTQDELVRVKIQEIFSEICAYFKNTLDEAQSKGLLVDIDTDSASLALLAYFEGAILLAKAHNQAELIWQLGQNALKLVRK